jgi:hypothetical protein
MMIEAYIRFGFDCSGSQSAIVLVVLLETISIHMVRCKDIFRCKVDHFITGAAITFARTRTRLMTINLNLPILNLPWSKLEKRSSLTSKISKPFDYERGVKSKVVLYIDWLCHSTFFKINIDTLLALTLLICKMTN